MNKLDEKHQLARISLLESRRERNHAEIIKLNKQATEISEKTGLKGMIVTNILSIFIVTLFFSQGILPVFETRYDSINELLILESKGKIYKAKSTAVSLVSDMHTSKKDLSIKLEDITKNLNSLKKNLKGEARNKFAPEIRKIVMSVESIEKETSNEAKTLERSLEELKSINIDA